MPYQTPAGGIVGLPIPASSWPRANVMDAEQRVKRRSFGLSDANTIGFNNPKALSRRLRLKTGDEPAKKVKYRRL